MLKFRNNQPKYERKHGRMNKKVRVTLTTIQPPMETHFFSGKGGVAEVIEFSIFVPKKKFMQLGKRKKKKVWCDVRNGKKKKYKYKSLWAIQQKLIIHTYKPNYLIITHF